MDRIDVMRLFTRIVDLGSFTAAAEDMNLPRATATHAIQQLERRVGVRLLHRTTRHVSPTLEGQAYYERCQRVLGEVEEAESLLGDAAANPGGRLRVDLGGAIGAAFLLPHLGEFCRRYPKIDLEIGTTDRLVDLLREGVDCVVRAGAPRDNGLVARRVALMPTVTCASRGYVEERGMPRSIEQFRTHQAVNFLSSATGRHSPFAFVVKGKVRSVTLKGRVSVTSTDAYTACCLQGLGFIQAPRYRLETYLANGELLEALPKSPPPPMPVAVMYPPQRQLAPRVRVFVDWVVEKLKPMQPASAVPRSGVRS
ncbi:LysR family transcriptional regulator [Variovorax defluvii]|uniref:LysR family transcriptional regulator n=1 Tax=Variovorax defluvii TaxID=913761 RepID=A0ABP8IDC2_9BURK